MSDKPKFARGGVVRRRDNDPKKSDLSFLTSRGCAVVSASMLAKYGRDKLSALNGGSEVLSAEEALAELDSEEGE